MALDAQRLAGRRQGVRRRIQERHDVRQGHRPKAVNLASDRRDEGIEISDAGRPRQLLRQPYPTGIMYSHHQDPVEVAEGVEESPWWRAPAPAGQRDSRARRGAMDRIGASGRPREWCSGRGAGAVQVSRS